MGEAFRKRRTALLAAGFALLSGESQASEDWRRRAGEGPACSLQAWADSADAPWLTENNAGQKYAERAKENKFDFIGPVDQVPWKAGCGDVWVAACDGQPNANQWLKLKSGTCPATATATSTATATATSSAGGGAGRGAQEPTAPTEPPRKACGEPEAEVSEPSVTDHMRAVASEFPEFREGYHRQNHYVDEATGVSQGVPDKHGGAEVNGEVAAWLPDTDPILIGQHYEQTSGGPWESTSRNSVAMVSQEGFSRQIITLYQIFRSHDDGHFHNDAEGVALVNQRAADKEREKQLALAETLSKIQDKLEEDVVDIDSVEKTKTFRQLANLRAANLAKISCQLGNIAEIDADRERRMRSLTEAPVQGAGDGDGSSTSTSASGVSTSTNTMVQVGPDGVRVSTVTFTSVETATATSTSAGTAPPSELDQILKPFGAADPPKAAPQEIGDADSDIFARMHAKLRQREELGAFRGTIVEEPPVQLLP